MIKIEFNIHDFYTLDHIGYDSLSYRVDRHNIDGVLEHNKLVPAVDEIGLKIDGVIFVGIEEFAVVVGCSKWRDFFAGNFLAKMNSFLLTVVFCANS